MLTTAAIIFIIFAAVFFLVLNLFRSLFKAISITLVIMALLGIFVGYMIINDAKDFSKTINTQETTYLLSEGSSIRTGFTAKRLNLSTFNPIQEQDIDSIREEPKGKIFIIKKEILNTTIPIPASKQNGLNIDTLLKSESADTRAQAFALLLAANIEEQGPFEMILHIKEEDILVEPKTPVVYAITATPRQLYKQAKRIVINEATKQLDLIREQVKI